MKCKLIDDKKSIPFCKIPCGQPFKFGDDVYIKAHEDNMQVYVESSKNREHKKTQKRNALRIEDGLLKTFNDNVWVEPLAVIECKFTTTPTHKARNL